MIFSSFLLLEKRGFTVRTSCDGNISFPLHCFASTGVHLASRSHGLRSGDAGTRIVHGAEEVEDALLHTEREREREISLEAKRFCGQRERERERKAKKEHLSQGVKRYTFTFSIRWMLFT